MIISACGSSNSGNETPTLEKTDTKEASNDQVYTIKLAHASAATGDRVEESLQILKDKIEERSNGRMVIETYPGSQLGNEREILEGVQLGSIEMNVISTGPLPGIFPEIMAFDLPYLFKTRDIAYEVIDGPAGEEIKNLLLEKTGIRLLAWGENGYRHFTNNNRPIVTPEDVKGLKYRTMENPAHMFMVETLGGSATPMAFGELYSALQQGVIDGQENPVSQIESMRFYEVQKHMTLDGHVYNPHVMLINEKFYQSLPDDLKTIMDEETLSWTSLVRQMTFDQEEEGIKIIRDSGVEIVDLTPEQKQAFQDAVQPVYDMIRAEIGDDLYEKTLKAVKEAEEKHLK
ncbi:DctP family TRAP transporter solute-binding subunit [bacterium LRH843]|nr:DctP family TRAP transporter solute-binding subunit [bacterium LRH843]